ncbi:hypothetical protein [Deinococcus arcticus]|uniref:Uncharacterized protein n=1 Tax=Deinococcus arcticus TaxID=2136176 RepID=A0A2T3WCB6_9DEIO|nr:hypothetical protein [Deinococcus arcticus]PTA69536.1 hypothetical protein C8263_00420 [Deinococcus arcticus]
MTKRFHLILMSTVLPGLLASCMDSPAQTTQPAGLVSVPEGCELEADGELDCDDDAKLKLKSGKTSKAAKAVAGAVAAGAVTSARAAERVNSATGVSRGGLTSTARASSSGGYGG